jgi:hypothetical protein
VGSVEIILGVREYISVSLHWFLINEIEYIFSFINMFVSKVKDNLFVKAESLDNMDGIIVKKALVVPFPQGHGGYILFSEA